MTIDITTSIPLLLILIALASPFGIPVGATFFIISAGSMSETFTDYAFYVIILFFGFVTGDLTAYATASHFEKGLKEKLCRYDWFKNKYKNSTEFLDKYGSLSVFLSRFALLGLGAPLNYISGFSKYPFRKFLVSAISGEFLYAVIYSYIGYLFKDTWIWLFEMIVDFSYTLILFLATLVALYQLRRYLLNQA